MMSCTCNRLKRFLNSHWNAHRAATVRLVSSGHDQNCTCGQNRWQSTFEIVVTWVSQFCAHIRTRELRTAVHIPRFWGLACFSVSACSHTTCRARETTAGQCPTSPRPSLSFHLWGRGGLFVGLGWDAKMVSLQINRIFRVLSNVCF